MYEEKLNAVTKLLIHNIETEIKLRNWSKKQFANKLNVSAVWLNNKLKGHRKINLEDLQRFVDTLQIKPYKLFVNNNDVINGQTLNDISIKDFVRKVCKDIIEETKNEINP